MARWTEKELRKLRESTIDELRRLGIRYQYLTCDRCPYRATCPWAYDPYNIDGDCLAEK